VDLPVLLAAELNEEFQIESQPNLVAIFAQTNFKTFISHWFPISKILIDTNQVLATVMENHEFLL
jgi:hypothetical protein